MVRPGPIAFPDPLDTTLTPLGSGTLRSETTASASTSSPSTRSISQIFIEGPPRGNGYAAAKGALVTKGASFVAQPESLSADRAVTRRGMGCEPFEVKRRSGCVCVCGNCND